jgi:hypothetical protein
MLSGHFAEMTRMVGMRMFCRIISVAIVANALTPAFAADAPIPPPEQTAPKESSVHADQPQCLRWTDECVSCSRGENGGAPVCSNIGVACQPQAIRCLQSEAPAQPATPPEEPKPTTK